MRSCFVRISWDTIQKESIGWLNLCLATIRLQVFSGLRPDNKNHGLAELLYFPSKHTKRVFWGLRAAKSNVPTPTKVFKPNPKGSQSTQMPLLIQSRSNCSDRWLRKPTEIVYYHTHRRDWYQNTTKWPVLGPWAKMDTDNPTVTPAHLMTW